MHAGKGADLSELQAQHCVTPEQWSWILCRVSVVPANKLLSQEINQLIGIELLTSYFLESFSSAMSSPNGLLSQKLCHYFNQGRTLNDILLRASQCITALILAN